MRVGIFGYNFDIILPLIARFVLHAGPVGFGALPSAMAIGSLVGAFRVTYRGTATVGLVLFGAAGFRGFLLCLALSNRWIMTVPLLVLLGACIITYFTTSTSRVQMIALPEFRGRVISLYAFLDLGSAPVGSLLIGTLAKHLGVRPAVGVFALACGPGTLVCSLYIRQRRAHSAQEYVSREVAPSA
jgi:hypothetical protein